MDFSSIPYACRNIYIVSPQILKKKIVIKIYIYEEHFFIKLQKNGV